MKVLSKRQKNAVFLFYVSTMTIGLGALISGLPASSKKLVRDFEKVSLKTVRAKCSVNFNEICLREKILPKYSNIILIILLLRTFDSPL